MSDPTRRDVLHAAMAAIVATAVGRVDTRDAQAPRPNILWLVSEDNNPFLGCYGDPLAKTPNIDALAKRGILYRHAFSTAPVCAPSRFGILTGVYPESCAPANHMRANAALPPALRTYPEYLREAGYYCTNNAKTDFNCDADPSKIFDESSPTAHYRNRAPGQPFFAIFNHEVSHESAVLPMLQPAGATGATLDAAGARPFTGQAAGESGDTVPPVVSPADVRVPAYLPDTPEIRDERARYYHQLARMDAQVGEKLNALEEAGLAEDTIVFYYSDNGGVLPRSKRYCYDDGLRCALIVAFPPKFQHLASAASGSVISSPVSLVDLAPTLLSLIGTPVPSYMQGAAFLGPQAQPRGSYVFGMRNRMDERYDFVRAATDGRYHYIRNYTPHRVFQHGAFQWQGAGYQSWEREFRAGRLDEVQSRFFTGPRPFEELYDLQSDPDQVHNLAGGAAHADRLADMRKALDSHMIEVVDNGFIPEGMAPEGYLPSRDAAAYPLGHLMELAAIGCARETRHRDALAAGLADAHPLVRHWAAQGLLMLGAGAAPARETLVAMMRSDPVPQNRVVAAEAVATIAPSADAVSVLAALLDGRDAWPVKLQAINALTCLGEQARAALPQIKRAAVGPQQFLHNAGRYLEAVLEGRYEPAYPVFEFAAGRPGATGAARD